MFPEDKATEEQKKRKVTHVSGRQSDGGVNKEKGHYFAGGFKEIREQSGKRSRMFRRVSEGCYFRVFISRLFSGILFLAKVRLRKG